MSSIVKKTLSVGGNVCFVGSLEAFREHYPDKAVSAGTLIAAEGNKKVVGDKFASVPSFRLPECHDEDVTFLYSCEIKALGPSSLFKI